MLSEKEDFVIQSQAHLVQSVLAVETYRLRENLGLFDTIMCFSSELLGAHADNFTEYALTLGKQT